MGINLNQIIEDAIVGKLLTALVDDGYRLEVSDQDGGGLHIYAVEEGASVPADGYSHWVLLVPGNGVSVISDYTKSLEATIQAVNDFADLFAA